MTEEVRNEAPESKPLAIEQNEQPKVERSFANIRDMLDAGEQKLRVKASDGDGISVKAREGLLEIELPRPKVLNKD